MRQRWYVLPFEDYWHTFSFHLSNRLEAASRSLVLHPPRVLRLSCLGLATKTAPLYEKKT